ncbi:MAG: FecR domain-containing protein [Nitrospirota bacterium]|nr:MAG: FecR domain-containing protein [Nitrospirota bacterium]
MRKDLKVNVVLLICLVLIPVQIFADMKAGDVVRARGDSLIERGDKRISAVVQQELFEEDNVVTGEEARVKMLFRDDSILTLGQRSKLVVKQYLYSPESKRADSIYELLDGKLRAVVGNSDFKVVTPTAYAAARGTIFIIWYDPIKNVTGIAVLEGEVEIGSIGDKAKEVSILTGGQMTLVYTGESPRLPKGFELDRLNRDYFGEFIFDLTYDFVPSLAVPTKGIRTSDTGASDLFRLTGAPPMNQQPTTGSASPVGIILTFP